MKGVPIEGVSVAAFTVPTDGPESDGTFEWDATTMVTAHASAGGRTGLGYTYGDAAARRVRAAREAIGPEAELFVDANGAYGRKQALAQAEAFAEAGVSWFEEPVSSDDLEGLALIRGRAPAGMDVAAGEYGFDSFYFRRMLDAGAVDVLQADATRCAGYTGFLAAAAVSDAYSIPLSAHTAPALHLPACCAVAGLRHLEYFFDHARVERLLLDGVCEPAGGMLRPDLSRPGHGLELKRADAERYRAA